MTKNSRLASGLVIIVGLIALALASTAYAKPDNAGQRGGRERGKPLFGEILSISEGSITIAPKIPDFIAEKMAERGMELPTDLPSETTISLTADTKWFVDSEKADASSFAVGDLVAIVIKPNNDGQPTALKVADAQTAKQFIKQQMQQGKGQQGSGQGGQRGQGRAGQGGFGAGGPQGQGNRNQRGGQGNRGPGQGPQNRPAFGEIIAIDGNSITIRPEVPAFIQAKMAERGVEHEIELPDELVFSLGDKTRFVVAGEPAKSNPFSVGDLVAVMGGRGEAKAAFAVVDYATVEARMKEEGGQGPRGGQGQGKKQGKRGKQGKGPKGQRE